MDSTIENMNLDGGCLCLDFINTVHSRTEEPVRDYFFTYNDIIRWTARTGIVSKKVQKSLSAYAAAHPEKAESSFRKMIRAREELFALFGAIAGNKRPASEVIDKLNRLLALALTHMELVPAGDKMEIKWKEGPDPLLLPLWMVVKSAYDVLTQESQEKIKACPSCLWLFLDKTKNQKRRWCNSLSCGSIDKASRYYYRKKEELKNGEQ